MFIARWVTCFFCKYLFGIQKRFAKNSFGEIGVIPENYVQALADPPEPTEPPPSFSTFSNNYPNLDTFNGNGTRSAYQPQPPSYDQHSSMYPQPNYMNNNSWQTSDTTPWQASAPTMNVRWIRMFSLVFFFVFKCYSSCFPNKLILLLFS